MVENSIPLFRCSSRDVLYYDTTIILLCYYVLLCYHTILLLCYYANCLRRYGIPLVFYPLSCITRPSSLGTLIQRYSIAIPLSGVLYTLCSMLCTLYHITGTIASTSTITTFVTISTTNTKTLILP